MNASEIEQLIEQHIPEASAQVSGEDGRHFEAKVTSAAFKGLSRVKQQQWVYAALDDCIKSGQLHAIRLKTQISET